MIFGRATLINSMIVMDFNSAASFVAVGQYHCWYDYFFLIAIIVFDTLCSMIGVPFAEE
jgi:hypothetical protein